MKVYPDSCIQPTLAYATATVELGVVISQRACDIPSRGAEHYIGAYSVSSRPCGHHPCNDLKYVALAVDMTARNLQAQMKRKGLPWTVPKGFDTFTPMGCVHPIPLVFGSYLNCVR